MSEKASASVIQLRPADKPISEPERHTRSIQLEGARLVRDFPQSPALPHLPTKIRDEVIDYYAFVFFQGGFRQLGMTFEQFLLAVAAIRPNDLQSACKQASAS